MARPAEPDPSWEVPPPLGRRRALADDVHDTLTALIMDHAIAPQARLNIEALARSLEVSPTPVREALARLESDGLVVKEALRGYRTAPVLTPSAFEQLFEFRHRLEPWAAGRAAERRSAHDLQRLRRELARAHDVPAGTDYAAYKALAQHDRAFHLLVMELGGNAMLTAAYERAHVHLHLFRFSFSLSMASAPAIEHGAVVEAIAARDTAAAEQAMTDHLTAAHTRIAQAISDDATGARVAHPR